MFRGKRNILILSLIVLGIAGAALAFWMVARPKSVGTAQYQTARVTAGALSETVMADGAVHAKQTTVLSWRTSGNIANISVKVGDKVKAGQTIATLDPASLSPALLKARSDLIDAQHALDDLLQSQVNRAKAQDALVQAQKNLNDLLYKQELFKKPNASPTNIEVAQAAYDEAQAQLNQANQFYSLVQGRPENDVQRLQAASQVVTAQRRLQDALINLTFAQSTPDANTQLDTNTQVEIAQSSLKDAQREWDRIKNGPSQDDVNAARIKIDAIQASLSQAEISTPFAGTITQVLGKEGDVVNAGTVLVRLEDMTQIHAKISVPEVDISRIRPDQPATLVFDAIPSRTYPATVIEIGRVGVLNQGAVNFDVEAMIQNPDEAIRPGMTASVTITVAHVDHSVLVPNQAIRFTKQGQKTVYILDNNQLTQVPIKVGISDSVQTQVLSGNIKEGDMVVLNPPSVSAGN
jgi:HlyD family secretion protein